MPYLGITNRHAVREFPLFDLKKLVFLCNNVEVV